MKIPHVHAELIKAWADGEEIEFFNTLYNKWEGIDNPTWAVNTKYRIKPKEIPWYKNIPKQGRLCWVSNVPITSRTYEYSVMCPIEIITKYDNLIAGETTYISNVGHFWLYAIPLTNAEINNFLQHNTKNK